VFSPTTEEALALIGLTNININRGGVVPPRLICPPLPSSSAVIAQAHTKSDSFKTSESSIQLL